MAIRPPRSSLGSTLRPWQRGSQPRKRLTAPLALSGMIPVLLSLVAYELPAFRASGECLCGPQTWEGQLPETTHGDELQLAPMARIDARGLSLDGRRVSSAWDLRHGGPDDLGMFVEQLETLRRNWRVLHPREAPPSGLLLAAPAGVPYAQIRRVTRAAASAGYSEIDFLVRVGEPSEPVVLDYHAFMESL